MSKKQHSQGSNEIKVIEGCSHFRAYDNPEDVADGVRALDAFFSKHLE